MNKGNKMMPYLKKKTFEHDRKYNKYYHKDEH